LQDLLKIVDTKSVYKVPILVSKVPIFDLFKNRLRKPEREGAFPYMGDPPMEEQGLNTVFDSDRSTWEAIRSAAGMAGKEHADGLRS
jgi:hypothetical protein